MKRRTFIANAIAGIAGIGNFGKLAFAQSPCPPQLTGSGTSQDSVSCGSSDRNLAEAAASLGPGQSMQFTKNTLQRQNDIQWSLRTIWHDPIRRELQYMGKPASSQSQDYSHYIYHEDTDTWTSSGQSLFPGLGHIWDCTFDTENGDYFFHKYHENKLRWFDRSEGDNGAWKESVEQTNPSLSGGSGTIFAAMGWHPNLFGSGESGILIWAKFRFFAFNPRTGQFSVLNPSDFESGSPYWNRSRGQAVYLPKSDQLICFARDGGNGDPAILIEAGAGNSADILSDSLVSVAGTPPIPVDGAGGPVNHGHVTPHPSNSEQLLLLDEQGQSRIWISSDQGMTWQIQELQHPFQNMQSWTQGEYTVGTISAYGVIVAMTSNSTGGETVIWNPGSI